MPYKTVIANLLPFKNFICYYSVFLNHLEIIEKNNEDPKTQDVITLLKKSSIEPFAVPDHINLNIELRSALKLYRFYAGITMGETYLWSTNHRLTKSRKTRRYEGTVFNSELIYRISYGHHEPFLWSEDETFEEEESSPLYYGNPDQSLNQLRTLMICPRTKVIVTMRDEPHYE